MATTTVKQFSVVQRYSGDYTDAEVYSCAAIAGSGSLGPIYFWCRTVFYLAIGEDDRLYVGLNYINFGSTDSAHGYDIVKACDWVPWCKASSTNFADYVDNILGQSGIKWLAYDIEPTNDPGSTSEAYYKPSSVYDSHDPLTQGTLDAGFSYISGAGATIDTSGYWWDLGPVANISKNQDGSISVWVGFPLDNTLGNTNDYMLYPEEFRITPEEQPPGLTDYYPWARHTAANSTWYSHNRTGGYLKRYNSGWKDVKNATGDNNSKGWRYYNNRWNISPKHGEGA